MILTLSQVTEFYTSTPNEFARAWAHAVIREMHRNGVTAERFAKTKFIKRHFC